MTQILIIATGIFIGGLALIFWRQVLVLALAFGGLSLLALIAVIVVQQSKDSKPSIESSEIVIPDHLPSEFLTTIRLGDDDRLYVSGYLESDSLMEITESIQGGVRLIEMESISGDVESLLNFSKLVEIYKKPILVRGICTLPCAVVAFASSNVTFEQSTNSLMGETGKTLISEAAKAQMLKRLAALGAKETDITAARQPNYDMSSLRDRATD
jgi:hypothetical protein